MHRLGMPVGQYIDLVQLMIERCLELRLTRKETIETLHMQEEIEPRVTEHIWQSLEEQNQEFFDHYYLILASKQLLIEYECMGGMDLIGIAVMPTSDGSHIPASVDISAHANSIMDHASLWSAHNSHGNMLPGINDGMINSESLRSAYNSHGNMLPGINDGMINSESLWSAHNSHGNMLPGIDDGMENSESFLYMLGADGSTLQPHPTISDIYHSPLNGIQSNSQSLHEPYRH